MLISPAFVKYQTKSGNYYLYDPGTNEIVRIGKVIYAILDDYGVLTVEEIVEKQSRFAEADIHGALIELDRLQQRGILCEQVPRLSMRAERILCQGKEEPFAEFLSCHRALLILELTQRCNLRCDYCCYGEHYSEFRKHGQKTLSLQAIKNAIKDFLDYSENECVVVFYGGEPLLEFELLQQAVFFAESIAKQRGMAVSFGIATNGTLLTDDEIHFLVAHKFVVTISLDGSKDLHDRYRVFRDEHRPRQRSGSYEIVMRNMQRFVELYPDYPSRGVKSTITATSDLDNLNDFMAGLASSFRITSPSYIREPARGFQRSCTRDGLHTGGCRMVSCNGGLEETLILHDGNATGSMAISVGKDYKTSEGQEKTPDFCDWTRERMNRFHSSTDHFVREFCRPCEEDQVKDNFPVFYARWKDFLGKHHLREVSFGAAKQTFAYRCLPGASRTFCSAEGALYACERTETGGLFKLGDANKGINIKRVLRLTEICRLLGDCGNCVAKRLCPLCPAAVSEIKNSETADAFAFQRRCQSVISELAADLAEYTSIMEMNRTAVDKMIPEKVVGNAWHDNVKFVVTEEQQCEPELGDEELQEIA